MKGRSEVRVPFFRVCFVFSMFWRKGKCVVGLPLSYREKFFFGFGQSQELFFIVLRFVFFGNKGGTRGREEDV